MTVPQRPAVVQRLLVVLAAFSVAVVGLGGTQVAHADTAPPPGTPATVSADGLPTWQINGVVWSQVAVGNTVYATGSFTRARPPGVAPGGAGEVNAGNIFAYDITTGNRVTTFNHSLNAQGLMITKSPDGSKVFVGGDFTSVDGVVRGHVAAFNTATGALNTSIAPSVSGQVRALAATASTLYVGGDYFAVNGSGRQRLSAVDSVSGALRPWAPTADRLVWAMTMTPDTSRVIAGGRFTTLNGAPAYGMGSLDAASGATMPWAANQTIRDAGDKGAIVSLRTDGSQVYGSGYAFGAGANFEGTFAAAPLTGSINWLTDCHGDTYDVLPVGQVVYSVSHAHDCSPIGEFPDTNPRVNWQHALATTSYKVGTNRGPDSYGWNYNGIPAPKLLQFYPTLALGSYTGQYQAAWSLAASGNFVVMGGEFPSVNGVAQQGLVRMVTQAQAPNKQGPSYTTNPARPIPSTTAESRATGTASVTFGSAWDKDNASLTYDVLRDNATWVYNTHITSNFWTLPNGGFTDTGLTPGSTHSYKVRITDPFGNTQWSPQSNTVTISGTNKAPVAVFTSSSSNLTASFDGRGSSDPDGTIASYAWNFGDGSSGTGTQPTRVYAAAGTYSVTLTVRDNAGGTNAVTHPVTVGAANQPPVAAFTSSTSNLTASFDGSGSSDPDGTVASYAWAFGDGMNGTGVTPTHPYAAAGTYNVTLTVTDNRGVTNAVTHPVTVSAPNAVLAADQFGRTMTSGWGNADTGGAWTGTSGLSVANGVGVMSMAAAGSGPLAYLGSTTTTTGADTSVTLSSDKSGAGNGVYLSVMGRRVSGGGDYRVQVRLRSDGLVGVSLLATTAAGAQTVIRPEVTVTGYQFVARDRLNVRFQVFGTSPTQLQAKVWPATTAEPTGWLTSATDSTAHLQAAGSVGLTAYLSGSATNAPVTGAVDNLTVRRTGP